jgi:hypothetical protein
VDLELDDEGERDEVPMSPNESAPSCCPRPVPTEPSSIAAPATTVRGMDLASQPDRGVTVLSAPSCGCLVRSDELCRACGSCGGGTEWLGCCRCGSAVASAHAPSTHEEPLPVAPPAAPAELAASATPTFDPGRPPSPCPDCEHDVAFHIEVDSPIPPAVACGVRPEGGCRTLGPGTFRYRFCQCCRPADADLPYGDPCCKTRRRDDALGALVTGGAR